MHRFCRGIKVLFCILLALAFLPVGQAENVLEVTTGEKRDQLVRVCLTRLGGRKRLDFTFTAPYRLESDNQTSIYFRSGSQVTFQIENDVIFLYYQEMGQQLGKSVSLFRSDETQDVMSGFRLTNFPALYMGDLNLDIIDGNFRLVLNIHVEDYLLGVIPYEMGEAFPMEALKAQTVAARTYALKRQGQYKAYDLVDNTNDQVFRGYLSGYNRSETAVQATRGLCGFYEGELAQCYYSASNGGQTELVQSVWSSRKAYDYYSFGEDPYDLANPESVVRRYKLQKKYSEKKEAPYKLREMIVEYLADALQNHGYKVSPDNVRIDGIVSASVDTPSSKDSKHMTNLHMELAISLRTKPEFTIRAADPSFEEVYLFEENGNNASETSVDNSPVPEPTYTPFTSLEEKITVDIPIFSVAEDAFSLDISSNYQNEIWSVVEKEDEFVIEVRRYGHGVGMSQRGAQWMAAEYNKTFQEILAFYYPGMELIQYPEQERRFTDTEDALSAMAGPAPTPTPKPTLMPLTEATSAGQWYAAVTEIADDSSLNLRAEPTLNGEILMRLYKGQRLIVIGTASEEGWVRVKTDSAEGYVLEKYLSKEK